MAETVVGAPLTSRDQLLAATTGELASGWLGLRCAGACNKSVYSTLKLMAARHGGHLRLSAALDDAVRALQAKAGC
jgi:hypothetical protein